MNNTEAQVIKEIAEGYDNIEDIRNFLDEVVEITDNEDIMELADITNEVVKKRETDD